MSNLNPELPAGSVSPWEALDVSDPSNEPTENYDHNAFTAEQLSHGNAHIVAKQSKRQKRNANSAQLKKGKRERVRSRNRKRTQQIMYPRATRRGPSSRTKEMEKRDSKAKSKAGKKGGSDGSEKAPAQEGNELAPIAGALDAGMTALDYDDADATDFDGEGGWLRKRRHRADFGASDDILRADAAVNALEEEWEAFAAEKANAAASTERESGESSKGGETASGATKNAKKTDRSALAAGAQGPGDVASENKGGAAVGVVNDAMRRKGLVSSSTSSNFAMQEAEAALGCYLKYDDFYSNDEPEIDVDRDQLAAAMTDPGLAGKVTKPALLEDGCDQSEFVYIGNRVYDKNGGRRRTPHRLRNDLADIHFLPILALFPLLPRLLHCKCMLVYKCKLILESLVMGTLTANQTRLPEYCEHKLPTSCRLSSIPNCCACADERAHAASYSTYIDGIGFVLRGTRWQRYCWFCKEFWEQRVRVSGLRSGQTKIPEVPDQTDFLKKWYEFHQGYRIVVKEDGTEERVAVLGEEFKDVSPGCLPRTLEELRTGRRREEEVQQTPTAHLQQETGPSIEDTLEQMFAAVSAESNDHAAQPSTSATTSAQQSLPTTREPPPVSTIHVQAMNPAASRNREYQIRRVAALRRELNRMRNGIERVITGLRDLGEDVPNYSETTGRLTALGDTLDTISSVPSQEEAQQAISSVNEVTSSAAPSTGTDRTMTNLLARVDEARANMEEARRARDQAASELDLAEEEFRTSQHRFHQIQREQRTTENYMRIFGTREEVIAQGENYESPIGGMFSRAEERFRAAEEVRREQRTLQRVLQDEATAGGEDEIRRLAELEGRRRDVWGVPTTAPATTVPTRIEHSLQGRELPLVGSVEVPPEQSSMIDDIDTPPTLVPTSEESVLEEYYAMLRQQDRRQTEANQTMSTLEEPTGEHEAHSQLDNFPTHSFEALFAASEREMEQYVQSMQPAELEAAQQDSTIATNSSAPHFSPEEWWHEDAEHIIRALTSDDDLRNEVGMSPQEASSLLVYFIDDVVSEHDHMVIDGLMRDPRIIWRTGLPAEWIRRRQAASSDRAEWRFFSGAENFPGAMDWATHYSPYLQTEVMAQAFQMSASVRHLTLMISPPARLQMLYRLQAGLRTEADVGVLEQMVADGTLYNHALGIYFNTLRAQAHGTEDAQAIEVNDARREMARDGNHSREELDARRRDTTHAFAVAAGRQAMRAGTQALLERAANAEDLVETASNLPGAEDEPIPRGWLISTLRRPWATPESDSETDSEKDDEDPEAQGLDARNTGRPEPKPDEELQVQMECKICYTQISEIACLPCGHLVMCRWCSEQHSPCMQHDRTRPRRAAACPVCRKGIRQKVRVYRA